ncbi:hypothetical protein HZA33_00280, partial [Candidatus Pacearchaeota archaeon]|nr:hypothetical protein [Candidatus Pacearchaeota archaeon]
NNEIIKKIEDFVSAKPRTIQEIAQLIKKNWRTADRYVERIIEEYGTLATRIFRGGTRGALKIVYLQEIEKINTSGFQERLFNQIQTGRMKEDFSPSEIYQYVDAKKKEAKILNEKRHASKENFEDFEKLLKNAKQQIFFFSGNLTFSNMAYHDKKILEIVEEMAKKGISTKILTRVEIAGLENIKNILSINKKIGKNAIEIRHCFQPLRATLIDNKVAVFKESLDPKNYIGDELKEKTYILYYIYDKEWIEWLQKIFWNLLRASISAEKRIEDIESMKIAR